MHSVKQDSYKKARKDFAVKPVDELLRLLADEDLRTRFLAEMSLRDATGT